MDTVNLTNHFLIAMPNMADPNFSGTLTYIADHGEQGALGVVVNRPIDLDLSMLFEQIGLSLPEGMGDQIVYLGGPVQQERGFVLHTPPQSYSSTLNVADGVCLTTSKDVLEAVAQGNGPAKFLVSLGYSGWSAGQLEQEMAQKRLAVGRGRSARDIRPAAGRTPACGHEAAGHRFFEPLGRSRACLSY